MPFLFTIDERQLLSALLFPLLATLISHSFVSFTPVSSSSVATVMCRTGVDLLKGPSVACANQCMNTTSPRATVYSCDFGDFCEVLNLINGCVQDGPNTVCCCFASDHCNFGIVDLKAAKMFEGYSSNTTNNQQPTNIVGSTRENYGGEGDVDPKVSIFKVSKSTSDF